MEKNGYQTRSKRLILQYLKSNSFRTVSVSDIYASLRAHGETTNITTIYRYLEKLEKEAVVVKHASENTKKACFRYIGEKSECENHLHIQCTHCGKIIHLDCELMSGFQKHLRDKHAITLDCSSSLLYGICDECRKKMQ
ncbi:MAG: transcriptional repressor [Treponema sp.]|jgi:Fur family ferric uptake transcriptional regulator|nr:transcriptional repressor [Treponema sp.]